MNIGIQSQFL